MKTFIFSLLIAAVITPAFAAEARPAGPKGGRLLDTAPLRTEFVVTADRHVEITFYDSALQPTAPTGQVVSVVAEPRTGRAAVALESSAHGFVSALPLPEATEPYRVVVQVRASADAKPQNFRIDLNLAACAECQRAEYACICESH